MSRRREHTRNSPCPDCGVQKHKVHEASCEYAYKPLPKKEKQTHTPEEIRKRRRKYHKNRLNKMTREERSIYYRRSYESSRLYQEQHTKRIERAIKLLEENGFKVSK